MLEGAIIDWIVRAATSNQANLIGTASAQMARLRDFITENFSDYFEKTLAKCSHVTVLFDRGKTLPLSDLYVNAHLELSRGSRIRDDQLRDFIVNIPAKDHIRLFLIVGSAGMGKTYLLRWLFVSLVENEASRIPLFVELRGINNYATQDLITFLHKTITSGRAIVSHDAFKAGLAEGGFILLLDGLDEVIPERRQKLNRELIELQNDNPGLIIVVTSRHDESLDSWALARRYSILPFNKSETIRLIKKIPYEEKTKQKFTTDVELNLYDRHNSFLSNPLLTSIMLLTYSDLGQVPSRMHLFYEQAFLTLFYRHDTWKEVGYQRTHYTYLPVNKFRDCLSSFSMYSYAASMYDFTRTSVVDTIEIAVKFERLDVDAQAFLMDLTESICVMQLEGLRYKFTHRGFQEYFSAVFICRNPPVDLGKLLDRLSVRRGDNVISMCMDMNRSLLERVWVIPRLKTLSRVEFRGAGILSFTRLLMGIIIYDGEKATPVDLKSQGEVATLQSNFLLSIAQAYPELDINMVSMLKLAAEDFASIKEVWDHSRDNWMKFCFEEETRYGSDNAEFLRVMNNLNKKFEWPEAGSAFLRAYQVTGGRFSSSQERKSIETRFYTISDHQFTAWIRGKRTLSDEDSIWFSATAGAQRFRDLLGRLTELLCRLESTDESDEQFIHFLYKV